MNIVILMLLLQYLYNKFYMASCNWLLFGPIINITFYLPLTTCHLDFVIKFLWMYCVLNIIKKKFYFCSFVKNIYVYSLQDSGLLYCWQQNEAVFSCIFFLYKQKITLLLQPIYLYLHWWFFPILFISLSFLCIFLVFLFIWSNCLINTLQIFKFKKFFSTCSNSKRVITCMIKKPYMILKKNKSHTLQK